MADHRIVMPSGLAGAPVVGGLQWSLLCTVRPLTTARSVKRSMRWYDAAGALISTSVGGTGATSLVADTNFQDVFTAPVNAAFCAPVLEALAIAVGEQFKWDKIGVINGNTATWRTGGALQSQYGFIIERSQDGGLTWVEVRHASQDDPAFPSTALPSIDMYDYEATLNESLRYRARAQRVVA